MKLSSRLTDTLALVTSMGDLYPTVFRGGKYRKALSMAVGCLLCYLVGLTMVTRGGMYILQLFDFYGASGFTLLWTATWQCLGVAWFYGDEKFYQTLESMVGYRPSAYYRLCWKYFAPALNTAILIFCIVKYEPLTYNKTYHYPAWGHAIGWSLALASILCIPLRAIYVMCTTKGRTWREKFRKACTPAISMPTVDQYPITTIEPSEPDKHNHLETGGPIYTGVAPPPYTLQGGETTI